MLKLETDADEPPISYLPSFVIQTNSIKNTPHRTTLIMFTRTFRPLTRALPALAATAGLATVGYSSIVSERNRVFNDVTGSGNFDSGKQQYNEDLKVNRHKSGYHVHAIIRSLPSLPSASEWCIPLVSISFPADLGPFVYSIPPSPRIQSICLVVAAQHGATPESPLHNTSTSSKSHHIGTSKVDAEGHNVRRGDGTQASEVPGLVKDKAKEAKKEEQAGGESAYNEETGEINWDCPVSVTIFLSKSISREIR